MIVTLIFKSPAKMLVHATEPWSCTMVPSNHCGPIYQCDFILQSLQKVKVQVWLTKPMKGIRSHLSGTRVIFWAETSKSLACSVSDIFNIGNVMSYTTSSATRVNFYSVQYDFSQQAAW